MSAARTHAAVWSAAALAAVVCSRAPAADPVKGGDDFKYLPADTNLLFVVKMDQIVASDAFKKLRKEIPMFDKEAEKGFRSEFGFDISNVDRITMGGNVKSEGPVGFIRLKKPVTAEAIVKARSEPRFQGDKGTTFKDEKVGSFTVFVPDKEYRDAFCLVTADNLVHGRVKQLEAVLEANPKPPLASAGMQAALKEAESGATVTLVMDGKVLTAEKPPPIPGVDFAKLADGVSGMSLTVKLGGGNVALRGVGVCKDEKTAEDVKKQAEAILKFLGEQMKNLPPNAVPKDLLDLPGKVKIRTKGNLGEATLTVKDEAAIAFLRLLFEPRPVPKPENKPGETKPIEKKP
jgi:hypothetical protein